MHGLMLRDIFKEGQHGVPKYALGFFVSGFFFTFLRISYAECIHCPLQYVEESYSCFSIIKRTLVNALRGIRRLCLAEVWRFSRGVLLFLTKYLFNKHSKQTKTCPFFRHNKRGSKQRPMMAHVRKHCLSCSTS